MTVQEAKQILKTTEYDGVILQGSAFYRVIEALEFIIHEEKDPVAMRKLAEQYTIHDKHELALKYYEMAAMHQDPLAIEELGCMYLHGFGTPQDWNRAYDYFERGYQTDDKYARFRSGANLASMYLDESFDRYDKEKGRSLLTELYQMMLEDETLKPAGLDVFEDLADMYMSENQPVPAMDLYYEEYCVQTHLITRCHMPGIQAEMKRLVNKMYQTGRYRRRSYDLYDLYVLLEKHDAVRFNCYDTDYTVEMIEDKEGKIVRFGEKYYRSVEDFMARGTIEGERIEALFYDITDVEVAA